MTTVLTGSNGHAIIAALNAQKSAFIKQYGEAGVEVLNADQIQPEQLASLLMGATLFASNRLVVIRNLSENKTLSESLLGMLETIPAEVEVVLVEKQLDKRTVFYKTLKQKADFQEFTELDEYQAVKWVEETVKMQHGAIDRVAAQLLVQSVGTDQLRLQHEIEKLLAYDTTISQKTIAELVEANHRDTVFQLLELALSGKTNQAIAVLSGLEQAHEDPFQITNMLIWQTHILAVVHSAQSESDSEIAKQAKVNPFVVRKTKQLALRMTASKLRSILEGVAQCDVLLKTTAAAPWRVVEQTILRL